MNTETREQKKTRIKARMAEIAAELNAYAKGWVSYDAYVVKALQSERNALISEAVKIAKEQRA